jgi:hypothetical protein
MDLASWANPSLLSELGFEQVVEGQRRFRAREIYTVPRDVSDLLRERLAATEAEINELVESLYL